MKTIKLEKYGQIISEKELGNKIYNEISDSISQNDQIVIDFLHIRSMATFCAKQIFGKLYILLTPSIFFEKIQFKNVTEDLKIIIQVGIQNALEEKELYPA